MSWLTEDNIIDVLVGLPTSHQICLVPRSFSRVSALLIVDGILLSNDHEKICLTWQRTLLRRIGRCV